MLPKARRKKHATPGSTAPNTQKPCTPPSLRFHTWPGTTFPGRKSSRPAQPSSEQSSDFQLYSNVYFPPTPCSRKNALWPSFNWDLCTLPAPRARVAGCPALGSSPSYREAVQWVFVYPATLLAPSTPPLPSHCSLARRRASLSPILLLFQRKES